MKEKINSIVFLIGGLFIWISGLLTTLHYISSALYGNTDNKLWLYSFAVLGSVEFLVGVFYIRYSFSKKINYFINASFLLFLLSAFHTLLETVLWIPFPFNYLNLYIFNPIGLILFIVGFIKFISSKN